MDERYRRDADVLVEYERLVDEDDEQAALVVLAEAVRSDSHPELKQTFREALTQLGDIEISYALCQRAVAKNPDSGELHCQLGELAVALDRPDEAVREFERAQTLGESGVDLYQLWAGSEIALGNLQSGEELFNTALEIAPDRVSEVYSAWGKALCDSGHTRASRTRLEVAIAADPTNFYPHAYLGVAQLRDGDDESAETSFLEALALMPVGHDAYATWIVQELVAVVERRRGSDAAIAAIIDNLKKGRRSMPLFDKLRRLQALNLGPRAKRFVLVIAGEDSIGDYYEECEVDADGEDVALELVRGVHAPDEAKNLVVADVKVTGRPSGTLAGIIDISEKARVPRDTPDDLAELADDEDEND